LAGAGGEKGGGVSPQIRMAARKKKKGKKASTFYCQPVKGQMAFPFRWKQARRNEVSKLSIREKGKKKGA